MVRIKRGSGVRCRRKKVLKSAKGFRGAHSRLFRTANSQVLKSLKYSYTGRKKKKSNFKSLWVSRINATVRIYGITYSTFRTVLKRNLIQVNTKMLDHLALLDRGIFPQLIGAISYKECD